MNNIFIAIYNNREIVQSLTSLINIMSNRHLHLKVLKACKISLKALASLVILPKEYQVGYALCRKLEFSHMFSSFPQQPWENLFWLFLTLPDPHLGQFSGLILSLMAAFPFQVWQLSVKKYRFALHKFDNVIFALT